MAVRNTELADFLRSTRARIDPEQAGLPADGRTRRVQGLRREEVARLAGISTDYYVRLEQGRRIVPSPSVVEALARALGLDRAGREHLAVLVDPAASRLDGRRPNFQAARPAIRRMVDGLQAPALLLGRRGDVLASNLMARALFANFDRVPVGVRNYARWMFLDEGARALFVDWEPQARALVDSLRLDVGRRQNDPADRLFVEELSSASSHFKTWWGQHSVYQRTFGTKRLRHPVVGAVTVDYETLNLPGDADQTLYLYTAADDSASGQALGLLASWAMADQALVHPNLDEPASPPASL
ncbi:helix-turn-helix transcriptional regulator [Actinoplanes sp. NPDC089786]|uniref:helix-turn-helix transcriptional regulator n=1 Tax=Actinoplanes sp. NPDC089786 TaxID=3155185 RepID=UPI00342A2A44